MENTDQKTQDLKDTLILHPEIEEVYYTKKGYSFNKYTDEKTRKSYTKGGIEFIEKDTQKKFVEFDPEFEITDTKTRDQILNPKPAKSNKEDK